MCICYCVDFILEIHGRQKGHSESEMEQMNKIETKDSSICIIQLSLVHTRVFLCTFVLFHGVLQPIFKTWLTEYLKLYIGFWHKKEKKLAFYQDQSQVFAIF